MKKEPQDVVDLQSYITGFGVSVVLILGAYFIAVGKLFTFRVAVGMMSGLTLILALVQLILFMHVGGESKPNWNRLVFVFMSVILCVIVFGSLWIMSNLDYRMM